MLVFASVLGVVLSADSLAGRGYTGRMRRLAVARGRDIGVVDRRGGLMGRMGRMGRGRSVGTAGVDRGGQRDRYILSSGLAQDEIDTRTL